MMENEQKEPWFLEVNPNGRIPAMTDRLPDGRQLRVFESGAMLEYLVDRYDKDHKLSYPRDAPEHWEVVSWVSRPPSASCESVFLTPGPPVVDVADGRIGSESGNPESLQQSVSLPEAREAAWAHVWSAGYAPEKMQYAIDRYTNETRRLYRTMDTHLAKSQSGYLVGDRVTIADISCWGWIAAHSTSLLRH